MDRCECYKCGERFECRYFEDGRPYGIMVGYNYCSGTKECDACSCGGDKTKCDFYPEIRKRALYEIKGIKTNADRIRKMSDEELMKFISSIQCCSHYGEGCGYPFCKSMRGDYCYGISKNIDNELLSWLKEDIIYLEVVDEEGI